MEYLNRSRLPVFTPRLDLTAEDLNAEAETLCAAINELAGRLFIIKDMIPEDQRSQYAEEASYPILDEIQRIWDDIQRAWETIAQNKEECEAHYQDTLDRIQELDERLNALIQQVKQEVLNVINQIDSEHDVEEARIENKFDTEMTDLERRFNALDDAAARKSDVAALLDRIQYIQDNSIPRIGNDGYWYIGNIKTNTLARGPKGDKGDKGDRGATGATGATGPAGPAGAKGSKGDKGDKGDTGPRGQTGATGPAGPQGPAGQDGFTPTVTASKSGKTTTLTITNATGTTTTQIEDGADGSSYTAGSGINITNNEISQDIPEMTIAVTQVVQANPLQVLLTSDQVAIMTDTDTPVIHIDGTAISALLKGYIYLNSDVSQSGINHLNYVLDYPIYDPIAKVITGYSKGLLVLDLNTNIVTFSKYDIDNTPAVPESSTAGTQDASIQNENGEVVINSEDTDQGTQAQIAIRGNTIRLAASNGVKVAATPLALDDVANKGYVDGAVPSGLTVITDNSSANPFILEGKSKGTYLFVATGSNDPVYMRWKNNNTTNYHGKLAGGILNIIQDIDGTEADGTRLATYMSASNLETMAITASTSSSSTSGIGEFYLNYEVEDTYIFKLYPQTLSNKLTFNTLPESSVVPTTNNQLTNKSYVDNSFFEMIAPEYSSSSTYDVGDFVIHEGLMYTCNTAISTAEAWNSSHWTQTSVNENMGGATPLDNIPTFDFSADTWPSYSWASGSRYAPGGSTFQRSTARDLYDKLMEVIAAGKKTYIGYTGVSQYPFIYPDPICYDRYINRAANSEVTFAFRLPICSPQVGSSSPLVVGFISATFKASYDANKDFVEIVSSPYPQWWYSQSSYAVADLSGYFHYTIGSTNSDRYVPVYRMYVEDNFLSKVNTTSYTPTADYNPATKKYVDDAIATAITSALGGSY